MIWLQTGLGIVGNPKILARFPSQENCIGYLEKIRWGDAVECPYCGATNCVRSQRRWYCYACRTSFSVTVGTVFHHTHLPLQKWFLAIDLILNDTKGISAVRLSRYLGVNKDTAWRMNVRIRLAMLDRDQRRLMDGILSITDT